MNMNRRRLFGWLAAAPVAASGAIKSKTAWIGLNEPTRWTEGMSLSDMTPSEVNAWARQMMAIGRYKSDRALFVEWKGETSTWEPAD